MNGQPAHGFPSDYKVTLAADLLLASLLSLSIGRLLPVLLALDEQQSLNGWAAFIMTMLIGILTIHWWVLPAVVLAGGSLSLLTVWTGDLIWHNDLWGKSTGWLLDLWHTFRILLETPSPADDIRPFWFRLILVIPLSVLCLAGFRFLHKKIIWSGLVLFPAGILILFFRLDLLNSVLLLWGCLVAMLPRLLLDKAGLKNPDKPDLPYASVQLLALPIILLCIWLGQSLIPKDTHTWQWMPLIRQIQDWQDLFTNISGNNRNWASFDLADTGWMPLKDRLGGPVEPSADVVMRVETEQPILIRSAVSSYYDGQRWSDRNLRYYRYDATIWWSIRRQVFLRDLPDGAAADQMWQIFGQNQNLIVTPRMAGLQVFFQAGKVMDINWTTRSGQPPIYFSTDGDLFTWSSGSAGTSYELSVVSLNRQQEGFDQAMAAYLADPAQDTYWSDIRKIYLQLPDNLPASVGETAASITRNSRNSYEQAVALETWLQENMTYTLNPIVPPENKDFVQSFLETREGYCVYFATTMVVMARTLDIPARYVEGFMLEAESKSTDKKHWQATGKTAHAYAELYFQGLGWITFDPTAAALAQYTGDPTPPAGEVTPPVLSPEPSITLPSDPGITSDPGSPATAGWLYTIIVPLFLLLFISFGDRLARRQHRLHMQPDYLSNRFPDQRERLDYYYQDILRQLHGLSLIPEDQETMLQFARRCDPYLKLSGVSFSEVIWPVMNWRYGGQEPLDTDWAQLIRFHLLLEERLSDSLSPTMYLLRRVLVRKKMTAKKTGF